MADKSAINYIFLFYLFAENGKLPKASGQEDERAAGYGSANFWGIILPRERRAGLRAGQ